VLLLQYLTLHHNCVTPRKVNGIGFWDETRGAYADDPAHHRFSEHAQCLALIAGVDAAKAQRLLATLLNDENLARTTIYFRHYLFEALGRSGTTSAIIARLGPWFDLPDLGLLTTPEQPEPTRSDCHAWGAHPWFHYLATILGIRPAAPGFTSVSIAPALGPLSWAEGAWPHPAGPIAVRADRTTAGERVEVQLPPGLAGTLVVGGRAVEIPAGGRMTLSA